MILIAIAKDVKDLENFRNQPSVTGAIKFIAEIPTLVLPKNMPQVTVFAQQIAPILASLKRTGGSIFSALIYEQE